MGRAVSLVASLQRLQQLTGVEAGHQVIQQHHQLIGAVDEQAQRAQALSRLGDSIARVFEDDPQRLADRVVVIHDQHMWSERLIGQ